MDWGKRRILKQWRTSYLKYKSDATSRCQILCHFFLVSKYIEKVEWNQISLSSFLFKISWPETWRQIKVEFWFSQNEKSKPLVDFSFFSFMRKTVENKGEQILVFSKPKIEIKGKFCFSSLGGRVVVVLILEPGVVVGPRPPPCNWDVKRYS